MRCPLLRWPIVALVALLLVATAVAQTAQPATNSNAAAKAIDPETAPRPVTHAVAAVGPIVVDGKLDEPSWEKAVPIAEFTQAIPDTGMPGTHRSIFKIIYDSKNIYVGAICYEDQPEKLVIKTLQKELPNLSTHELDIVGIYLDTYLDRRNAFLWLINPMGAYRDGQSFNDSRSLDFGWNGICEIKTQITNEAWTVELRIPWTTLRFDPTKGEQAWGLNLLRRVKWRNEETYWAPLGLRDRGHRMSKAGTLDGIQATRPGRNLVFKPYALTKQTSGPGAPVNDVGNSFNAGLDFKYGITPRMTADLTYRTDFSDVEVDKQIVNLTRFPIFFDEMRDFFIENSGTFQFGDVSERNYRTGSSTKVFTLFNSRQIGLKNGVPVPILGGGRLTGRAGSYELGLLNVQTQRFQSDPAENFSVARVRRNIGRSDVGVMFGNRQATGSDASNRYNRSYGVDANVKLWDNLIINSYFAGTSSPGRETRNKAGRVAVGYRDPFWDVTGYLKQVGANFNPGIGFIQRSDIRDIYGTFGIHPRPKIPRVMEVNPYVEGHRITTASTGQVETQNGTAGFAVSMLDGSTIGTELTNNYEYLYQPFAVNKNVVIPPGGYSFNEGSVSYTSNAGRSLYGSVGLSGGGYYGGRRSTIDASVTWEMNYRLSFFGSVQRNALSVQGQSFPANVYGGRIKFSPSVNVFLGAYVQYNNANNQMVTNLRMDWLYSPLSDVYVVYTERRDMYGHGVQEQYLTVKLTKYLQF